MNRYQTQTCWNLFLSSLFSSHTFPRTQQLSSAQPGPSALTCLWTVLVMHVNRHEPSDSHLQGYKKYKIKKKTDYQIILFKVLHVPMDSQSHLKYNKWINKRVLMHENVSAVNTHTHTRVYCVHSFLNINVIIKSRDILTHRQHWRVSVQQFHRPFTYPSSNTFCFFTQWETVFSFTETL